MLSFPKVGTIPPSILFFQPRLAGVKLFCIASIQITASIDPEADVVCPVNAFVLEISGISSPKIRISAWLSVMSLFGVPVP